MNKIKIVLTEDQIAAASKLRATGMGFDKIAKALGLSRFALECELIPGRRQAQVERTRGYRSGEIRRVEKAGVAVAPDSVLAEREARLAKSHSDLTAELMGDPLPGRSALDTLDTFRSLHEITISIVGRLA